MNTPEYIRKAQNNYNSKFDLVQVKLPKGTKQRIKKITKESYNTYISRLVAQDLERYQRGEEKGINNIKPTPKREPEKPVFDVQELYQKYGQKMNDIMTQIEIKEKYGDEALQELYELHK